MKTVKVADIFNVRYGTNLELVNLEECKKGENDYINFVSRTEKNNGISAYVQRVNDVEPNPAYTLSVAGGGSVLSTFFHKEEYYSGRDIYILIPKKHYSEEEMLFYAYVITKNKYRFNYGRQANKTLKEILIPDAMPKSWQNLRLDGVKKLDNAPISRKPTPLSIKTWEWYRYDEIFEIKGGFYNKKPDVTENGDILFIGATEYNNGVTSRHTLDQVEEASKDGKATNQDIKEKIFPRNCITVSNDGSVGNAFFQPREFTCSHSVNPIYLRNQELNVYIAMFLCTIISQEKYRWNYGRKWRPSRMPDSLIKLPSKDRKPDWSFMEEYIKSLSYSASL